MYKHEYTRKKLKDDQGMALDSRYVTTTSLEEIFVDKDSGELLANGTLTFYEDDNRAVPKLVYELTGAPPNYTYTAFPNPITLSSVGTVQDNGGTNTPIYYFPFDANGDVQLYYIVAKNEDGVVQFTREGFPNTTNGGGIPANIIDQNTNTAILASGFTYICDNGNVLITFSLPALATLGDIYTIVGGSLGGWTVDQNALQTIHMGNQDTTIGIAGGIASTNRYDCVIIQCVQANSSFVIRGAQGNIAII